MRIVTRFSAMAGLLTLGLLSTTPIQAQFGRSLGPAPTEQPAAGDQQLAVNLFFRLFEDVDKPAEGDQPPAKPVEIAAEPTSIDPATIMPEKLAEKVTVEFTEKNLKDIVKWLQDEQGLSVLIDQQDIVGDSVSLIDSISDSLNDEPLYHLLDRLNQNDMGWYLDEDVLHITSVNHAEKRMATVPYNIGSLIDAGYEADAILETIRRGTSGSWEDEDGEGGAIILLGDVVFVRQPGKVHREVAGLMAALKQPARRTFTLDAPQHATIRAELQERVAVEIQDEPLLSAVKQIAELTEIDIRLDGRALRQRNVRDRTPVTLKLEDQKLSIVLQALVSEWGFQAIPKDGVLWITSKETAELIRKTAVYDVRDLCRNDEESMALEDALVEQTRATWDTTGDTGGSLSFAKAGVLVVFQTEAGHEEILQLLENYRTALRASKPRPRKVDDPKEVITLYYRMPTVMAEDLQTQLRLLIKTETWKNEAQPEAVGTILKVTSKAELLDSSRSNQVVEFCVLIIHQSRENHQKISELIFKVEHGDAQSYGKGGMGGMGGGMGGGGFGGGYFSVPRLER